MSLVGALPLFLLLASWPAGTQGRGYSKSHKSGTVKSYRPIVVYSDRIYCLNEDTHKEVPCMQHDNKKTTLALAITGPILAAILLALGVYVFIRKRRYRRRSSKDAGTLGAYVEIKDEFSAPVSAHDQEQPKFKFYKHPTTHVFLLSIFVALPFSLITLLVFSLTPRYNPFPIAQICKSAVIGWAILLFFYLILLPWTWLSKGWVKLIPRERHRILACWGWIWTYWFASPLLGTTIAEMGGVSASNVILPTWVYTLFTIAAATVLAVYGAVLGKWYAQGSGEEVD
ncbi:hypothetical protein DL96DRAFT_1820473 [Flagelloscypha sp. PMI_526]|nr:hypothetical protein DL96DRAFT_1820473 [Flagelloscypha sp. PMI_526]